jgi:hypothetical protein
MSHLHAKSIYLYLSLQNDNTMSSTIALGDVMNDLEVQSSSPAIIDQEHSDTALLLETDSITKKEIDEVAAVAGFIYIFLVESLEINS